MNIWRKNRLIKTSTLVATILASSLAAYVSTSFLALGGEQDLSNKITITYIITVSLGTIIAYFGPNKTTRVTGVVITGIPCIIFLLATAYIVIGSIIVSILQPI